MMKRNRWRSRSKLPRRKRAGSASLPSVSTWTAMSSLSSLNVWNGSPPAPDMRDYRVLLQLWREMTRLGIARRLENAGIEAGNTIRIGKAELEWF